MSRNWFSKRKSHTVGGQFSCPQRRQQPSLGKRGRDAFLFIFYAKNFYDTALSRLGIFWDLAKPEILLKLFLPSLFSLSLPLPIHPSIHPSYLFFFIQNVITRIKNNISRLQLQFLHLRHIASFLAYPFRNTRLMQSNLTLCSVPVALHLTGH